MSIDFAGYELQIIRGMIKGNEGIATITAKEAKPKILLFLTRISDKQNCLRINEDCVKRRSDALRSNIDRLNTSIAAAIDPATKEELETQLKDAIKDSSDFTTISNSFDTAGAKVIKDLTKSFVVTSSDISDDIDDFSISGNFWKYRESDDIPRSINAILHAACGSLSSSEDIVRTIATLPTLKDIPDNVALTDDDIEGYIADAEKLINRLNLRPLFADNAKEMAHLAFTWAHPAANVGKHVTVAKTLIACLGMDSAKEFPQELLNVAGQHTTDAMDASELKKKKVSSLDEYQTTVNYYFRHAVAPIQRLTLAVTHQTNASTTKISSTIPLVEKLAFRVKLSVLEYLIKEGGDSNGLLQRVLTERRNRKSNEAPKESNTRK